jgi:hypothetical protein
MSHWELQEEVKTLALKSREKYISSSPVSSIPMHTNTTVGSLFVTEEGHIGGSYHPDTIGIRAGYVLVALFGVEKPCILRPVVVT